MNEAPTAQEQFLHCPRCGADGFATVRDNFKKCGACGFSHYFNPAVAVGGILTDPEGRMLLIRRKMDPGRGKLGIPGGFVDMGESAEHALAREVFEETGLRTSEMRYLVSIPNRYATPHIVYYVLDIFFHCPMPGLDGCHCPEEVSELVIRPPAEVVPEEMAFRSNAEAIQHFVAASRAAHP